MTAPAEFTVEAGTGALIPITSRTLSVRRFMGRLTLTEQVALTAVRINPATPLEIRAQLETLKDLRDSTQGQTVNLDDADTLLGQQLVLGVLSQLPDGTPGRIDPADVPARLAAWRADFPQPGEPR